MAERPTQDTDLGPSPRETQQLPIELIDHIIRFLDDRNENPLLSKSPTLLACSLVCWAWNSICRPQIFRKIILHINMFPNDDRLYFLHHTAPHLKEHICDLILYWDTKIDEASTWVPESLVGFVNLRSLSMESIRLMQQPLTTPMLFAIASLVSNACGLEKLRIGYWMFMEDSTDLLLILAACAPTPGELTLSKCTTSINESAITSSERRIGASIPPVVRLEALRKLELRLLFRTKQTNRIECPNLRSLTCEHCSGRSTIPRWVPADLEELTLKVDTDSELLYLSESIRPSILRINMEMSFQDTYLPALRRVRSCLGCLPSSRSLRRLYIVMESDHRDVSGSGALPYPHNTDYEELYDILKPLYDCGSLKFVHYRLRVRVSDNCTVYEGDHGTKEVEKLKEVFLPLLDMGQLAVDISFRSWSRATCRYEVLARHSL